MASPIVLPPISTAPTLPMFSGSAALPISPALSDPVAQFNPISGRSLYGGAAPTFGVGSGTVTGFDDSPLGQYMHQRQLQALQSQGLPLTSDPNAWTPQEASAQTDAALAKIATVNPDLAKQLAAQRQGQGDSGGSFWHSLGHLWSDIAHPALSIGGKLLDIISRPAHIVPGLLVDDNKPWYQDIGDALTGRDKYTWADVLKQWGVNNGLVRGVLGFGLDVATDPVTYLFPAGAGASISEHSAQAGLEVAAKSGGEWLAAAGQMTAEDGYKMLKERFDGVTTDMLQQRARFNPDAIAGIFGRAFQGAQKEIAGDSLDVFRAVYGYSRAGILRKFPDTLALSSGRTVTKEDVFSILDSKVREGNFANRDVFNTARAYAAAEKGWRLKFAVPFTRLRYISGAVPFSEHANFNLFRQFFAGQLGMTRLADAINRSADGSASVDDMVRWAQDGWSGAHDVNPELFDALKGRGPNLGHGLYSLSERMGGISAHMLPHAKQYRAGLQGYWAAQAEIQSRVLRNNFLRDAWMVDDPNRAGKALSQPDVLRKYRDDLGIATHEKYVKADPAAQRSYIRFLESFPHDVNSFDPTLDRRNLTPEQLGTWMESRYKVSQLENAHASGELTDEAYAEARGQVDAEHQAFQDTYAAMTPKQRESLFMLADQLHNNLWNTTKDDVWLDNLATNFAGVPGLRDTPEQMGQWQAHTPVGLRDTSWEVQVDTSAQRERLLAAGVTSHAKTYNGDAYGIHMTAVPAGEDLPEGAVKVRQGLPSMLVIDENQMHGTDVDLLKELQADARSATDEARGVRSGVETIPTVSAEIDQQQQAEMLTEALLKRGKTSILYKHKDGTMDMTLLNPRDARLNWGQNGGVHVVSDNGYFPRVEHPKLMEFLNGRRPDIAERFFNKRSLKTNMRRETADLSFDDSEGAVRQFLVNEGFDAAEVAKVPIWDDDVLRAMDTYFNRSADSVVQSYLGRTAENVLYMGDLAPRLMGQPAGYAAYRWHVDKGTEKAIMSLGADVQEAFAKTAKEIDKYHTATHELMATSARRLGFVQAYIQDQLSPELQALPEGPLKSALTKTAIKNMTTANPALDDELKGALQRVAVSRAATEAGAVSTAVDATSLTQAELNALARRSSRQAAEATALTKAGSKGRDVLAKKFSDRLGIDTTGWSAADKDSLARLERLLVKSQSAYNEGNRLFSNLHTQVAEVRPALVPGELAKGQLGMVQLNIPGLEQFSMPAYMAAEFQHAWDKAPPGELRRAWRQWVQGPWKRWATYRFPGFHVRNFYGAWWNNWLGGVNTGDYDLAWKAFRAGDSGNKWATTAVDASDWQKFHLGRYFGEDLKGQLSYKDLHDVLMAHGYGRASTTAVAGILELGDKLTADFKQYGAGLAKRVGRKYERLMQNLGSGVEDYHRIAAWAGGMRTHEGDMMAARAFTMVRQGDYEDLTSTEEFLKDLIPFYKWTRTNTPYQLHQLAENPEKLTIPGKLQTAVYQIEGTDQQESERRMPTWLKQSFAIPLPFGKDQGANAALKYAVADLPMADLYQGFGDYLSMFLPMVRPFIESYGFGQEGKTFFSGSTLTGKMVPLSGWADVPGIRDALVGLKLAEKGADGKVMISDKTENILTGVPIYSRFRNWVSGDPNRVMNRMNTVASGLFGVQVRDLGPNAMTNEELAFYYDQLLPVLEHYRSLGVQFPDKRQLDSSVFSYLGLPAPAPKGQVKQTQAAG